MFIIIRLAHPNKIGTISIPKISVNIVLSGILTAMKEGQANTDKTKTSDTSRRANQPDNSRKSTRNIIVKKIVVSAILLSATLTISTIFLRSVLSLEELVYLQAGEIAVIGYFVLETVSSMSYRLVLPGSSLETAKAIRSLIRISGTIIIAAVIISFLAQNPIVAASISTITALVVGFASQNLLANMISGLYLSIMRPFKIGDRITISSNSGVIYDIQLIYTRVLAENGDIVLVPSSSMLSSIVILQKGT
jgi:small-conductance mechanosensitive channel